MADNFGILLKISLILIAVLLLTSGCSQLIAVFESKKDFRSDILGANLAPQDYTDHLADLGRAFLATQDVEAIKLSPRSQKYLEEVYYRIVRNNELLLDQNMAPVFHVIKDRSIFYFSLPNAQIFLSQGLVDKYFRSEELFVACLTHEIIRSHRKIYEKKSSVPVGFVRLEKMLFLTRVSTEVKTELNKLSFFAMRRAGYDANAYLNWLQTQNKNTLDFMLQLGESRSISREELAFKNFLISEEAGFSETLDGDLNSSPGFYSFLNEIKRTR